MRRSAMVLFAGVIAAGILSLFLCRYAMRADTAMRSEEAVLLPIAMYHSVTDCGASPGEYVISPTTLEADFRYLSDHGFHTVTVTDVIDYVNGATALPDNPVMLTFDDGYYNNYANMYPLLDKYDMCAVLSPVGTLTEQFTAVNEEPHEVWSYCTQGQLQEMAESGRVEMQNHSYDFHELSPRRGCLQKRGESDEEYRSCFLADTQKAQELFEQMGIARPNCYTYPYGALNEESEALVKECGFAATLGCEEGVNTLAVGSDSCLYRMKRYNRDGRESTETFWSTVLRAMQ